MGKFLCTGCQPHVQQWVLSWRCVSLLLVNDSHWLLGGRWQHLEATKGCTCYPQVG